MTGKTKAQQVTAEAAGSRIEFPADNNPRGRVAGQLVRIEPRDGYSLITLADDPAFAWVLGDDEEVHVWP
jgi:hypothetical protein